MCVRCHCHFSRMHIAARFSIYVHTWCYCIFIALKRDDSTNKKYLCWDLHLDGDTLFKKESPRFIFLWLQHFYQRQQHQHMRFKSRLKYSFVQWIDAKKYYQLTTFLTINENSNRFVSVTISLGSLSRIVKWFFIKIAFICSIWCVSIRKDNKRKQ